MRRAPAVVALVTVLLAISRPAAATPVVLVIDDPDVQATIRLSGPDAFEGECTPADPPIGGLPLPDTLAYMGGTQIDILHGVESPDGHIYLASTEGVLVPSDGFCRVSARVNEMLYAATPLPDPDWPWAIFIGLVGFLMLTIAYVAAMGRGVGPLPTMLQQSETEPQTPHDDAEAEASAPDEEVPSV